MADAQATLWIKLKDDVTAGLNKIKGSLPSFTAILGGVTAALAVMGAALKASFDSFLENEAAVNRLNTALKAQGFFSEQYSKSLQDVATGLQKTTAFSDEAILETQTLLTTFGLAGQKLNETTRAALDLSKGLGIDLRTATLILGKAWNGETGTLSRYGIKIKETGDSAKDFAQVLASVNSRFGGAAAAELKTYSGQVANLANQWDDVKEKIGALLLGPAAGVLNWMRDATTVAGTLAEKLRRSFDPTSIEKNADAIDEINIRLKVARDNQKKFDKEGQDPERQKLINDLLAERARLSGDIAKEQAKVAAPLAAPESKKAIDDSAAEAEAKLLEESQKKILNLTKTNEEIDAINTQHMVDELDFMGRHEEAKNLIAAQAIKNQEVKNKAMVDSSLVALNMLASFANSKNKEVAAVGKAAAFASAVINAHLAATLAMSRVPPPWGLVLAGVMEAAGLAQAAAIAGVPLAHGGMIMPTTGGTQALIGEGGRAEAVVPLDDPRTKEKLRDTLGGSGGDIHIHIAETGTVIADDYSIEQFARKIDEKLFSLRRNRQSTAFD